MKMAPPLIIRLCSNGFCVHALVSVNGHVMCVSKDGDDDMEL